MNVKRASLIAVASCALASGIAVACAYPHRLPEFLQAATTIVFAMATFAWFRADAIARSYKRSPFLNVAVFGLAAIALPYYFVRSRGWKGGLGATAGAIGVFLAACTLYLLSALAALLVVRGLN